VATIVATVVVTIGASVLARKIVGKMLVAMTTTRDAPPRPVGDTIIISTTRVIGAERDKCSAQAPRRAVAA
jgi:hypothetical protein